MVLVPLDGSGANIAVLIVVMGILGLMLLQAGVMIGHARSVTRSLQLERNRLIRELNDLGEELTTAYQRSNA